MTSFPMAGKRFFPALAAAFACTASFAAAASDLDALHPSFNLQTVRPSGFEPRVSGMDFLPGGKLVLSTWKPNEVYVIEGADGPAGKASYRKAADGFTDIMGLCVSGDTVFIADQDKVYRLEDRDGNGLPETKVVIGSLPFSGGFHEWSFGLVRREGRLYTGLSVATSRTGRTTIPQANALRGAVVAMDDKGNLEVIATGLRAPEGMGEGPEGSLFVTDNQGSWLPASKLIHVVKGRTYGHRPEPPGIYDSLFPSPPAAWLPYGEATKSPTQPVLATAGAYAGQMFYGDIASGVVRRVFLEKVNGEWQGCVLRFSGGFEAAVHRMVAGKDGSLWLGGLGKGDQQNWGWRGKLFGLQRLVPNGKPVFEIKSARARQGGFELEFTERPGAAALKPARYSAKRWWYEPTAEYGGKKKDEAKCAVKSVKLSGDGKRVFVAVEGLQPFHVIHVRLDGVKSEAGRPLWTTEFWYTLNALSAEPFKP